MTTQENVDRLIKLVGSAVQELTTMQGVMNELTSILLEEKYTKGSAAQKPTELTIEEKAKLLEEQTCPDCGSKTFYEGPSGGLAANIKCVGCDSEFNVGRPYFAERI